MALIKDLIRQAAERHGVDPALALAVAERESAFNPQAMSSKGAKGIFQLMPATARELGVTDPFDAAQNIDGGVRYLKQTLNWAQGDVGKALAMYNFGYGRVTGGQPWPEETQNYVAWILSKISIKPPGNPTPGQAEAQRPGQVTARQQSSKRGPRHG
jgi:soluble lytic murein transglycosylase-like protein